MLYQLQNNYQDDTRWQLVANATFTNKLKAINKAKELSKDSIVYGTVRVISESDEVIGTFIGGRRYD